MSARELALRGSTTATDAAEISVASVLLGGAGPICRRGRTWWSFALLFVLAALVPLEVLVELGIGSNARCGPHKEKSNAGVCASPWGGHSNAGIASAALLTQRFEWVDQEWDVVLEGAHKIPRASEVRKRSVLRENRRVVAANCSVVITPCGSSCGTLQVQREHGAFDTIVTNATIAPRNSSVFRRGDVTYDKATALAFLFWDDGTVDMKGQKRKGVRANGVEVVLSESDTARLLNQPDKIPGDPWFVKATATNSRRYSVFCETDGVPSNDLARCVSLYRTTQMEQPGVQRDGVDGRIDRVAALSGSDAAKAMYAMKSSDWSGTCEGELEVYSECGNFSGEFVAPFFAATGALVVLWVVVSCALKRVDTEVPHDARSWREQAHKLVQVQESPAQRRARSANGFSQGDAMVFESDLFDVERFSQRTNEPYPYVVPPLPTRQYQEYDDFPV